MKLSTAASLLALAPALLFAEAPRVLPPGELPKDARLQPLKDLDGYFPFAPSSSPDAWKPRAERVRMQMRVALGLWPEPSRTPLNPVIHGRIDGDDYTVEKVFFESMPGFFVTGSLYRPKAAPAAGKKRPAILCPHGHWEDARFRLLGEAELKKELASGGERLANGGRSIFQSLGVQLARMGCVAFVYDMLGNSDSQQISSAIAHKFARQRPEMNAKENWGLYSPQAELHAQSVMGLQTWNSIRALDFLTSLPDVDPQRLGCTGASGGGTQTMILAALDPRLTVSCPAVMVSTAMQGGCTCENASLLRVDTGNVEFAALFAPKPQGLTAADDWTKEMETKGFPELKKHYAMIGAPDHVALWAMLHFGHNYNAPSREKIYGWFNEHLQLGLNEAALAEREYTVLNRDQLTVWDAEHRAPPGGADFERKLLSWWHEDAQQQLAKSPAKFREIALPAWKAIIGRSLADVGEVEWTETKEIIHEDPDGGKFKLRTGLLRSTRHTQELPIYILAAAAHGGTVPRVLWVGESGKNSLFEENATTLRPEVRELLKGSSSILAIDLLYQGEFLSDGMPLTQTKRVKNPREAAAYTFGYNHALFAQRVHDLLSALQFLNAPFDYRPLKLVAFGKAGPIAAAARVVAAGAVGAAVIDTSDFDFAAIESAHDVSFLPGAAKYGGLPGLLALSAPERTYVLHKGTDVPAAVRAAYANVQKGHQLDHAELSPQSRLAAIKWLNTGRDAAPRLAE